MADEKGELIEINPGSEDPYTGPTGTHQIIFKNGATAIVPNSALQSVALSGGVYPILVRVTKRGTPSVVEHIAVQLPRRAYNNFNEEEVVSIVRLQTNNDN